MPPRTRARTLEGAAQCTVLFLVACLFAVAHTNTANIVRELGDTAAVAAALNEGTWFILVDGGADCERSRSARKILAVLAAEFFRAQKEEFATRLSFAQVAESASSITVPAGSMLLAIGKQGGQPQRFIEFKETPTLQNVRHFLWYYVAEQDAARERFPGAVTAYQRALEANSVPEVHAKVAGVLHQRLRDLPAAVRHYDAALERAHELHAEWHVRYLAGNAFLTLGYQERALVHYLRSSEMNPAFARADREAAIAATVLGNASAAEEYLRRAVERDGSDADAVTDLASLLLSRALAVSASGHSRGQAGGSVRTSADGAAGGGSGKAQNKKKKKKRRKKREGPAAGAGEAAGEAEGLLDEAEGLLGRALAAQAGHSEALYYRGMVYKVRGARALAQRDIAAAILARDRAGGRGSGRGPVEGGLGGLALPEGVDLKIFVYDLPSKWNAGLLGLNMQQCRQSIYSAEVHVHEQLLVSASLTLDPAEADVFYIPLYAACHMSSNFVKPGPGWPDNDVDIGKTYESVAAALDYVARSALYSPSLGTFDGYFNRSQGADHVIMMSSDWGSCQVALSPQAPEASRSSPTHLPPAH